MEPRTEYWVFLEGKPEDERAEVCRLLLEAVAQRVVLGAMDLPMECIATASPAVLAAAGRVRDFGVPAADRNATYMATGLMSLTDPSFWDDFVAVAPHAYYADVWDEEGAQYADIGGNRFGAVAYVRDSGLAVGVKLTPAEAAQVGARVDADLLPAEELRRRRWTDRFTRPAKRSQLS